MPTNQVIDINIEKTFANIPVIDSSINYWFVRSQGGDYYVDYNINNYIGIDYNEITLKMIKDSANNSEVLKAKIIETYSGTPREEEMSQPGKIAGQLLTFTNRIKENDIVIVPSESSQRLLVGVVTGKPRELSLQDIKIQEESIDYKHSGYQKRIPITWKGSFDRDKADTALYKMIFSQHAISNVNNYKSFINRAMFPVYIEDEELHITFNVTNKDNVNGRYLGQFMYFYTTLYENMFPGESMEVKVNVQSPGPVENIAKNAVKGLFVFAVVATVLSIKHGGSVKVGSDLIGTIEITLPGIEKSQTDIEFKRGEILGKQIENDEKQLKLYQESIDLAVKLRVPISELGIELPEELVDDLQKEVDRQIKEQTSEDAHSDEQNNDSNG